MELVKPTGIIRFGAFELDRNSGELRKSGLKIHLRDQPFRILIMLLERPGEIITREEIQKILWPNDTVVEYEHSVNAAIKALRQALGDDADNPRFVETLPRRGYRFIAPVDGVGPGPGDPRFCNGAPALAADAERPTQGSALPIKGERCSALQESGARYRLLEKLGAGGMGEVWRARDTKLNRDVALKFLPEDFTTDPKALERFKREAQLASALSHPHICSIYDTGELEGRQFISMELVEGRTLAARLAIPLTSGPSPQGRGEKGKVLDSQPSPLGRGWPRRAGTGEGSPLPMDTVLEYGIEIAGALAAAHRLGIIHRDLKPQNIMLTKSGTKLLDFGLAKLTRGTGILPVGVGKGEHGQDARATAAADSLTAQGAIMGTLHYMAPEQLEGKPADARSDIFAFGCVLYEMATGKRAFEGESSAQVMAAIMQNDPPPMLGAVREPPSSDLAGATLTDTTRPPQGAPLQRVVMKCLAKDPDERWQSAADLRDELKWIKEGDATNVGAGLAPPSPGKGTASRAPTKALTWVLAVATIAAVALAIVAARYMLEPREEQAITFLVHPPSFTASFYGAAPMLSPDGRKLVFIAQSPAAEHVLWVRSLDDPVAKPLPGTENALSAFWSPDSRHLGFVTIDGIKRIDPQGGAVTVLWNATTYGDATWSRDGTILFPVPAWVDGRIYRVPDAGDQATPVTALDPSRHEVSHEWPRFLPDGMHFLYTAYSHTYAQGNWVCVGSLESKKTNCLVKADSSALYAPEGYLLYVRGETLVAQPFDAKRFALIGDPVPIAQPVDPHSFSVSDTGVLAYLSRHASAVSYEGGRSPTVGQQLIWFDRAGKKLGTVGPLGSYSNPALSPDATKLAVDVRDPEVITRDIWIFDLKRATASRLNSNPADDFAPVWSADGTRIFFTSDRTGQRNFYQKAANGLGESEVVFLSPSFKSTLDLSPDGRYLLFNSFFGSQPLNGLWILPQFGSRQPASFIGGKGDTSQGSFSPDGRYLAYISNETGSREVYIQSFPEHRAKLQISADGGDEPAWRRDGKELFYLAENKMMAVSVKADDSTFQAGIPRLLFEAPLTPFKLRNRCVVTPDGQRFLCIVPERQETPPPITVVVNWPAFLKNGGK